MCINDKYILNIIESIQHCPPKTIRRSSCAAYNYLSNVYRMPKRNFDKDLTFTKSTIPQYAEHRTMTSATEESDSHQFNHGEGQSVSYKPK
jgi:hypothetical protein